MDTSVMDGWSRDFATELPVVPIGRFVDFSPYAKLSKQPARVRKLPVLQGRFDSKRFDFTPGLPSHVGWGSVHIGRALALTFRVQVGPSMLYWLANASDPEVWRVMDQWAASNAIIFAAEFDDGRTFIGSRDYCIAPGLEKLRVAVRQAAVETPVFVADVTRAFLENQVNGIATSDISAYPKLEHVQGRMVHTRHTGPVAVMVNAGGASESGATLNADVTTRLSEAIVKPGATRH